MNTDVVPIPFIREPAQPASVFIRVKIFSNLLPPT
ncbi:hypothetical protein J2847_000733 [Azospirillum agricola]|nr:hypothetical protein [Azospirillum agricola]